MESFRNCGWPAFAILLLAVLGFVVAAVAAGLAAARKRQAALIVGALGVALSLGALGGGPLGAAYGRSITDAAVAGNSIDPVLRESIRATGYAEAGACVPVGLSLGVLPALLSITALALALALSAKREA